MSINQWVISWLHDTLWLADASFAKQSKWNDSGGESSVADPDLLEEYTPGVTSDSALIQRRSLTSGELRDSSTILFYQPYRSSDPRLCSVVLAPGVGWKMCFRRTEESWSLWWVLRLVRADLNSNSQTNTLDVSHLSLAYGSYKVKSSDCWGRITTAVKLALLVVNEHAIKQL